MVALLCCCPMNAQSELPWYNIDGVYYRLVGNNEAVVTYKGKYPQSYNNEYAGHVVIPETVTWEGKKYIVKYIEAGAFAYCDKLTGITIPSSIKSVGLEAFAYCYNLTAVHITDLSAWCDIDFLAYGNPLNYANDLYLNGQPIIDLVIPEDVTEIKADAFQCWDNLRSVTIHDNVTSIGRYSFQICNNLSKVTIGKGVRNIDEYAFYECRALTDLVISESVRSIGEYAFCNCRALTDLVIPDSVTTIGAYAFYECRSLATLTLGSGVQTIGDGAFVGAELKSVHIKDLSAWCNIDHADLLASHCLYLNGELLTDLVVPEDVTEIKKYSFYDCNSLKSLTIHDNVKSIADKAFYHCDSLKSVTIGDGVTIIGDNAFEGCYAIDNLVIGNSVVSIGNKAFYYCNILTNLEIPNSVETIGDHAFEGLDVLEISIGNSVKTIGYSAFYECDGITTIEIPNSVLTIGDGAFGCCDGLESVAIGNSVTTIGDGAFAHCNSLTTVNIPESVTYIGSYAFKGDYALNAVHINNLSAWCNISFYLGDYTWDNYNLESNPLYYAHNLYLNGELLTDLVVPEDVTEIKCMAFAGCTPLKSVTFHNNFKKSGDFAFMDCPNLTAVHINDLTAWCNIDFRHCGNPLNDSHKLYLNGELITDLVIPEDVTVIKDHTFEWCNSIKSITLHDNITSIGFCSFQLLDSVTNINIPESVTSLGVKSFLGCSGVTDLVIPNAVKVINEGAFQDCIGLKHVTIGTGVSKIDKDVFYNCPALEFVYLKSSTPPELSYLGFPDDVRANATLIVPKGSLDAYRISYAWRDFNDIIEEGTRTSVCELRYRTIDGKAINFNRNAFGDAKVATHTYENGYGTIGFSAEVTSIGENAFYECTSLVDVEIPKSVTFIGKYAFRYCSALENVDIPGSVSSIGPAAFEYCTGLKSIDIPNSVTSIGEWQFNGCSSLESVTLPDNITMIDNHLFQNCTALTAVDIPNNVTSIEERAFNGCTALKDINIPGSVKTMGLDAFFGCTSLMAVHIDNLSAWCKIDHSSYSNPLNYANDFYLNGQLITDLVIPDDVTEIKNDAFQCWDNLKSVTIHDNVISIGHHAFQLCDSLVDVKIGAGVTSIDVAAFKECPSLKTISLGASVPPTVVDSENFTWSNYENAVLIVPEGSQNAYKNAGVWRNFKKIHGPYFKINYIVDGEVYATDSIAYGDSIVLLSSPEKEGYTFSGWSEAPSIMPADDITIDGTFSANYYRVTYVVDGEVYATDSIACGDSIVLLSSPEKEGYTFSGWGEAPSIMPADDITIDGTFIVNYYRVTYVVDGEVYATDSIAYGDSIVLLSSPEKEGYTFSGWGEAPSIMPAEDIVVSGAFVLTAIDGVLADAIVNVNGNSISISGVNGMNLKIYTLNGTLVESVDSYDGEMIILEKGVYIIYVGNDRIKINL